MQRLAIFSFIGILVLLLASTLSGTAVRKVHKKPGGVTETYITATPPEQTAGR